MNTLPVTPLNMVLYLLYLGLAIGAVALWFLPLITPASIDGIFMDPAPDLSRYMVTDKLWRRGVVTSVFVLICLVAPVIVQFEIWHQVATGELIVIREAVAANGWTQTHVITHSDWSDMTPVSLDTLDQVQTETGEFKPAQQVAYGNLRNGYLPSQESWEHTENWIRIFPENEPSGWNATFAVLIGV